MSRESIQIIEVAEEYVGLAGLGFMIISTEISFETSHVWRNPSPVTWSGLRLTASRFKELEGCTEPERTGRMLGRSGSSVLIDMIL